MAIYYSKVTGGLYDTSFADYSLPTDVVVVTPEKRDEIIFSSMITVLESPVGSTTT